jgi:formylglycine-generating enzyme required for sulfatase activity
MNRLKTVTLPNGLVVQQFPMTNLEYKLFEPEHTFPEGKENHPVVNVNYWEAHRCAKFFGGRLPTEEEWEYACRACTTTKYNTGDTLTKKQANFDGVDTTPVGSYPPNKWGLYDMHGNVWEWTSSRYSEGSENRVLRGGSWDDDAGRCRSANRDWGDPGDRYDYYGFRVVFVL